MPNRDPHAPFIHAAVEASSEGMYFVDTSRQILSWNAAAERLSGYEAADAVGRRCFDNILRHVDEEGNELCFANCPLAATVVDGRTREARVFLMHRDGYRRPVAVRVVAARDAAGAVVGAVEVFSDGTQMVRTEETLRELERQALIDSVTAIGNRRFLELTITTRLDELKRHGWPFGVLLVDVDRFKRVNDRFGHDVGDKALKTIANTMVHCARGTDAVGRWGGDEFLAVLANVTDEGVRIAAERIRVLVERSTVDTGRGPLSVTVSVGGTAADAGCTVESLLRRADQRVSAAKGGGRNRVAA